MTCLHIYFLKNKIRANRWLVCYKRKEIKMAQTNRSELEGLRAWILFQGSRHAGHPNLFMCLNLFFLFFNIFYFLFFKVFDLLIFSCLKIKFYFSVSRDILKKMT